MTNWIFLPCNRQVDPYDLAAISIEDVAHCLAQENRWNGSACYPWSVAAHSLLCVQIARQRGITDPDVLLCILMHDVEEFAFRDIPRGIKCLPELDAYNARAADYRRLLFTRFDVPDRMDDPLVKWVDDAAAEIERRELHELQRVTLCKVQDWRRNAMEFVAAFHEIS